MLIPTDAPMPYRQILLLAERHPTMAVTQARQLWQRCAGSGLLPRAWAAYTLGWALLRRHELPDARAHLHQAQADMVALGQRGLVLHCRRALLIAELGSGSVVDRQGAWEDLVADYRAAELPLDATRTQIHQIGYFNIIGLPQVALALAREIEPQVEADGTVDDRARLLRVMAIANKQAGAIDCADEQIKQVKQLFTSLDYPVEVAKCLLEQAHIAERQGALLDARSQLDAALALFHDLQLPVQIAFCEKTLGIVASSLGELDQALAMTLRARTTFLQCGQREQAASCDLSLGNVAYYSGLFDHALAAYRRAQTAYADLGARRLTLIVRRNQALVLHEQGQFSAAYAELCTLEAEVAALGDALELAEVYQAQAHSLRSLQRYDAALERLARAEQHLGRVGSQVSVAECWLERGDIYLDLGNVSAAEACLHAAEAAQSDQPIYTWRVLYSLGRCAEARGATATALDHYRAASALIAQLRHTLVNEHASSAMFVQARHLYDHALRLAADSGQAMLVLTLAEQQRALALQQRLRIGQLHIPGALYEQYQRQQQTLRTLLHTGSPPDQLDALLTEYTDLLVQLIHSGTWPERLPSESSNLEHMRTSLNRAFEQNWLVLSYVEYGAELLIVALDQTQLTLSRTPVDTRLIRLIEQVSTSHHRMRMFEDWPRLQDPTRRPWAALCQLAEALVPSTIRALLRPDLRLLIVPSERLHSLPWATLRVDEAWLCERVIIQIIPSLSLWQVCATTQQGGGDALIIGCSTFGPRASDLEYVALELEIVVDAWDGASTRLYNAEATRAELLRRAEQHELARYALVHIASHAQLSAAHGLLAHVMLWDEDLLYDEIARLGLAGAVVVLSTCDGAASEVLPGDEVLNLARAFLCAGARDVVANMWPSYDAAAPQLMALLYRELLAGYDVAHAVARMQRVLLALPGNDSSGMINYRSPLVWGGLHVVGSGTTCLMSARGPFLAERSSYA